MKRVIVTGGAGFIGSALCRHLMTDQDLSLVVIDKLTYAASPDTLKAFHAKPKVKLVQKDICDREAVRSAINEHQPDTIFHLAAETHVDRSITGASDFISTNIVGTQTLLDAALGYWSSLTGARADAFRFVHISTDEVYGSLGPEGAFCEETAYDPSSPYSASKAASDHLAKAWHRTYGLPTIISNCSNNYGPYQFPEKLIPLMTLNAMSGLPLPIYGTGTNVRDWLFVDDHVSALIEIARHGRPGETYNVGGDTERTNIEIVELICAILDEKRPGEAPHKNLITFVQDRPGHDLRYAIDSSKLKTELGWSPQTELEDGLRQTVDWYLTNEDWWEPLRDKVYGGGRLGLVEQHDNTAEAAK